MGKPRARSGDHSPRLSVREDVRPTDPGEFSQRQGKARGPSFPAPSPEPSEIAGKPAELRGDAADTPFSEKLIMDPEHPPGKTLSASRGVPETAQR